MDLFTSLCFCFQYSSSRIYNSWVRHYEPNTFIALHLLAIFLCNTMALTFLRCTYDKMASFL